MSPPSRSLFREPGMPLDAGTVSAVRRETLDDGMQLNEPCPSRSRSPMLFIAWTFATACLWPAQLGSKRGRRAEGRRPRAWEAHPLKIVRNFAMNEDISHACAFIMGHSLNSDLISLRVTAANISCSVSPRGSTDWALQEWNVSRYQQCHVHLVFLIPVQALQRSLQPKVWSAS